LFREISLLFGGTPLATGVAGVCCERRRSAQEVKETFQKGTNVGGEGLVPRRTHRRGHTGSGCPTGETDRDRLEELLH